MSTASPAYLQPCGRRMYRAVGGGWTWNRELADPALNHEHKENTMTVLTEDGSLPVEERTTPTMGYPLPPEPPRVRVSYDGWGRYKLPSPSTGRPTAFTRATTVADTLDDTYNLSRWKRRETARRVLDLVLAPDTAGSDTSDHDLLSDLRQALADGSAKDFDAALDRLDDAKGGRDSAELGTAVHAWIEAVDIGMITADQVPDKFQPYLQSYQSVLARFGLVPVPQYVERIVLNDQGEETVVGTLDRIYRVVATGELILGDVKTSKTLEYSYLTYAIQLAVYGYATKMLAVDGSGWEPMPEINTDFAIIVHVPSDQPEQAEAVTMDLWFGGESMVTSLDVRRRRKMAKKQVPYKHAIPIPTEESLRYTAAWLAVQTSTSMAELTAIWEEHQDVWDDDLAEYAETVSAAYPAPANAPANA